MAEKVMTTEDLEAFLKIPPEQHFRSQEGARKAASIWKALAEASTDPAIKAQWQSASDNALKAAENLSPAKIHNSAVRLKKELQAIKGEIEDGKGTKTMEHLLDCNIALMDALINKPSKQNAK